VNNSDLAPGNGSFSTVNDEISSDRSAVPHGKTLPQAQHDKPPPKPDATPVIGDIPSPKDARWTLRVGVIGLIALVSWAAVGKIDQVTHAQAQIIASARTQVVQSPDGGVMTMLHVKEGDVVKAGQLLVTLQKERAASAVSDSNSKVAALRITLARLHAEVYGVDLKFDPSLLAYTDYIRNQSQLYQKRQTAFKEDISALENILSLAEDELRINRQLEATGDVSRADILRLINTFKMRKPK